MISSASGYEWVNVAGLSSFITGDIMPVRDNRGDGSWQRLKYEDLLFLMEAQLERANWRYAPSASVTPLGRAMLRLRTLNQGIWPTSVSGWVNEYLDREAAMPTGIVATTSSAAIPAACGIGAAPFAARPSYGLRQLKADELRMMFYNVKLATRTVTSVTAQDLATAWTSTAVYTKIDGSISSNDPGARWGLLWDHGHATRVGSRYDVISITYKSEIATYPHATAATLLVKVHSHSYNSGGGEWYDIVSLPCSVSAGAIAVPSLSGIAPQIAALHGLNYTTAPGYITTGGGYINITDMALVVDHVFPAEINSVNWNWSPQTV